MNNFSFKREVSKKPRQVNLSYRIFKKIRKKIKQINYIKQINVQ